MKLQTLDLQCSYPPKVCESKNSKFVSIMKV